MSNRRWWLLGGLRGEIGEVYHYISPGAAKTACGEKLPVGRFVKCADSSSDRRQKRCPSCVQSRRFRECLPVSKEK